ncbi:MAG TPA: hypothetical protein DDW85_04525 [Porphyromonadaceae bacterium]|nr:hypothetical protein [Porphyromonadaceae bacterium]
MADQDRNDTFLTGYLSQIRGRRIQKRNFLKAKNTFISAFRKKFKQFLSFICGIISLNRRKTCTFEVLKRRYYYNYK